MVAWDGRTATRLTTEQGLVNNIVQAAHEGNCSFHHTLKRTVNRSPNCSVNHGSATMVFPSAFDVLLERLHWFLSLLKTVCICEREPIFTWFRSLCNPCIAHIGELIYTSHIGGRSYRTESQDPSFYLDERMHTFPRTLASESLWIFSLAQIRSSPMLVPDAFSVFSSLHFLR